MTDRLHHLHNMVEALTALRQSQRAALVDTIRCLEAIFHDRNVYSSRPTLESLTVIVASLQDVVLATTMAASTLWSRDKKSDYDSGSEFEDETESELPHHNPQNQRFSQPAPISQSSWKIQGNRRSMYASETPTTRSALSLVSGGSDQRRHSLAPKYRQSMYE